MNNCYFCSKSAWLFLLINTLAPPMSQASVLDCKELYKLTNSQVGVIYKSYERGAQDNLGYTLAAISLVESQAGKYRLNLESKDIGLYQINVKTIQGIAKPSNRYQLMEIVQDLVFNDELNAKYALNVLRYYKSYHKGDWRKMVKSYNAGHNSKNGTSYLEKVTEKVSLLRKCEDLWRK